MQKRKKERSRLLRSSFVRLSLEESRVSNCGMTRINWRGGYPGSVYPTLMSGTDVAFPVNRLMDLCQTLFLNASLKP